MYVATLVCSSEIAFVSVSSRSYILSYQQIENNIEKNILEVSVSSRSYILSYFLVPYFTIKSKTLSFRLLSELYSLLLEKCNNVYCHYIEKFPSPLGVIFSLILIGH